MATRAAQEALAAVQTGDLNRLRELIKSDPELIQTRTPVGLSLVMMAAYNQQEDVVDFLLDQGVTIDLFEAAATGKLTRVIALVKENPDTVNDYSPDGFTALEYAAYFAHSNVVDYLLRSGADSTLSSQNNLRTQALHSAAVGREVIIAEALLAAGADVNACKSDGSTPLHVAAQTGQSEMVKLFLARGADPQARNAAGQTPADLAETGGYTLLAELLRSAAGDAPDV